MKFNILAYAYYNKEKRSIDDEEEATLELLEGVKIPNKKKKHR